MNPHLFFQGKLGREEVTSAFLATLLEQQKSVRNGFFDLLAQSLGQELADSLKRKSWKVGVEKDAVDIRLEALRKPEPWVILIENKIQSGSKQVEQLRRYYLAQIGREEMSLHA